MIKFARQVASSAVALGILFISPTAHAQGFGATGATAPQFDLSTFWNNAFGLQYTPGESGLVLGDVLPGGSIEALVYEPGGEPVVVGSISGSVDYAMTWITDGDFSIYYVDENSDTHDGDGVFNHSAFAGTLTTSAGTFHLSGLSNVILVDFWSPSVGQAGIEVFTPTNSHHTLSLAIDAADQLSTLIPDALELPTFIPPEHPDPSCADDCQSDYDLAVQIAQNNYGTATDQCSFSLGGIGTGCGIGAIFCAPGGVWGITICCIVGGVVGGMVEYTDCLYDALLAYNNALANAQATYISCMEGCGYIVVYD